MDGLKPEIKMEYQPVLIGGEYVKTYSCKQCGAHLKLGQMACSCGLPIVWEGVQAWEKLQKKRKSCKH